MCPHCGTNISFAVNGACPSCGARLIAAVDAVVESYVASEYQDSPQAKIARFQHALFASTPRI